MKGLLAKIFHLQTSDTSIIPRAAETPMEGPENERTLTYKEYPRFPKIYLPKAEELTIDSSIFANRVSTREFNRTKSIPIKTIASLLGQSAQDSERPSGEVGRPYPSGGASYPLEIYLSVMDGAVDSLAKGLYHYDPQKHTLNILGDFESEGNNIRKHITYKWAKEAPVVLIFTAMWDRTMKKYGDFGYHLVLLEAGHLAQNMILVGNSLGLGTRPLVGFHKKEVASILDVDLETESPLYILTAGWPARVL
ncbi:MAG: SagB/ThcOx family dehydrogenase [Patescibacteria group bacterium]